MEKKFIHNLKSSHSSLRKNIKKKVNDYKWVILNQNREGILIGIVSTMSDEQKNQHNIPLFINEDIDRTKFYLNGTPKYHEKHKRN